MWRLCAWTIFRVQRIHNVVQIRTGCFSDCLTSDGILLAQLHESNIQQITAVCNITVRSLQDTESLSSSVTVSAAEREITSEVLTALHPAVSVNNTDSMSHKNDCECCTPACWCFGGSGYLDTEGEVCRRSVQLAAVHHRVHVQIIQVSHILQVSRLLEHKRTRFIKCWKNSRDSLRLNESCEK